MEDLAKAVEKGFALSSDRENPAVKATSSQKSSDSSNSDKSNSYFDRNTNKAGDSKRKERQRERAKEYKSEHSSKKQK